MSCEEHISQNDGAIIKATRKSMMKDNSIIKGFVTIIKNEGKEMNKYYVEINQTY